MYLKSIVLHLIIVGDHLVYFGKIYSQFPFFSKTFGNFCEGIYFIGCCPLLTYFKPMFHFWKNQVIGFYEEDGWKTHEEE